MKVLVTQSCPILCNPMDGSLPGSSVHGILQARILQWVAIPFSRDLPDLGIEPRFLALQADSLPSEPQRNPINAIKHNRTLSQCLGKARNQGRKAFCSQPFQGSLQRQRAAPLNTSLSQGGPIFYVVSRHGYKGQIISAQCKTTVKTGYIVWRIPWDWLSVRLVSELCFSLCLILLFFCSFLQVIISIVFLN